MNDTDNKVAPHVVTDSPSGQFYFCKSGLRHSADSGLVCCLCGEPLVWAAPADADVLTVD